MEDSSCPLYVFKIPPPKTQRLSFEQVFKNVDTSTLEIFKKITGIRDEMKGALDLDSSFQAGMAAVEKYLPHLFGLMEAAEQLPPDFSKSLRLIWTTPLSMKWATQPFVYTSFRFEVVMVLTAYGLLLRNLAHNVLTTALNSPENFDEDSKVAASYLTKASGIFDHLSQVQLTKWTVRPDIPMSEATEEIFVVLSTVSLAEAQEISIKKGLLKGLSSSTLAKLAFDISQKFEYCSDLLKKSKVPIDQLPQSFVTYLSLNANLWRAFSFKLLAKTEHAGGHFGIAVAYLKQALNGLEDRKDPLLENFLGHYNAEKKEIQTLMKKISYENDTIYYDPVPQNVTLPEAKTFMKPQTFEPPQSVEVTIIQKDSSQCSIQ